MESLPEQDLHAVRTAAEALVTVAHPARFPRAVLDALRTLIDCDVASYEELDPVRGMLRVSDPETHNFPDREPLFLQHLDEHPMIAHLRQTGDPTPYRFSDFLSDRQLHALPLYHEVLHPIGVERQTGFSLASPLPPLIGVTVSRSSGRDFSNRDLAVLSLLRPTVALAHETVRMRAVLATIAARPGTVGLAVLDEQHRIAWASTRAWQVLRSHYGDLGASLPDELWSVVTRASSGGVTQTRVIGRDTRHPLQVRFVPPARPEDLACLLVEEVGPAQADDLRTLGLSDREAEVLALLIRGLSNRHIAEELFLSVGTIRTHVARIFAKLGVHTRAEAAWAVNHEKDHDGDS